MENGMPLKEGAFPPPPGIVPNFEMPSSGPHRDTFLVYMVVFYTLTVAFCAARAYVKVTRLEMLLDDWLCILSFAFVTMELAANIKGWQFGFGRHVWEIEKQAFIDFIKWSYIASGLYIPMVFTTKAAILLLYARIFSIEERVSRLIRMLIWLLLLTLLPLQVLKMAICSPVSAYWELSTSDEEQTRYCRVQDQQSLFEADITIAIVTDLLMFIIPIPLTISLSFPLRKKIRILLSLLSGSGAVGVAIYKGIMIFHGASRNDVTWNSTPNDITWNGTIFSILTWIECTIGLCCACVPSVSILIDRMGKRVHVREHLHRRDPVLRPMFQQEVMGKSRSILPTTFDTELALLSDETRIEYWSQTTRVETDGRCKRLNSDDGRQEGWLRARRDPAEAPAATAEDTAGSFYPWIKWL